MPPRPSSPMMRYRSARIVPGVNPPTVTESEEIPCASCGAAAAAAPEVRGGIVGIWERRPISCPHAEQKRLFARTSAVHEGHCIGHLPLEEKSMFPRFPVQKKRDRCRDGIFSRDIHQKAAV